MGVSHIFINPTKREYFTIEAFGEYDKHPLKVTHEDRHCLHAMALALLLLSPAAFGAKRSGSWSGDVTHCPSDHSMPDSNGFNFGVRTATDSDPEQNLHQHAREQYTDISVEVVDMLCSWETDYIEILFARAARMCRHAQLRRILACLLANGSYVLDLENFKKKCGEQAGLSISTLQDDYQEFETWATET